MERRGLKSGGRMWGWDWPHGELPGYPMAELHRTYGTNYLAFIAQTSTMTA